MTPRWVIRKREGRWHVTTPRGASMVTPEGYDGATTLQAVVTALDQMHQARPYVTAKDLAEPGPSLGPMTRRQRLHAVLRGAL